MLETLKTIDAVDGATFRAPAGTLVRAYANSYTILSRGSVGIAGRAAIIDAEAGSLTIAGPKSVVFAQPGARVIALRGATVWMEPGADVESYGAAVELWNHSNKRHHASRTKQLVVCLVLVICTLVFSILCSITNSLLAALGLIITVVTGLAWFISLVVSQLQTARQRHETTQQATYTLHNEPMGQLDQLLDRELAQLQQASGPHWTNESAGSPANEDHHEPVERARTAEQRLKCLSSSR